MTATEISQRLAARAEDVAMEILPGGKRSGNAWLAGSLAGESGNSLSVVLGGAKAGVWKDFAGDADDSGDLIGLWQKARNLSLRDACKQALDFLGIADDSPKFERPLQRASKVYVRPDVTAIKPAGATSEVSTYLVVDRGLDRNVLARYRVSEITHPAHGASAVFPVYNPTGEIVCLKYLAVKRNGGKKIIWSSADSEDRLFGWQGVDKQSRQIIITEGEIDALTVAGWGYDALSLPRGVEAMGWIDHDWNDLSCVDKIYLCFDTDAAGQKAVDVVAMRIGRERCWRIKLPKKDANECLKAGMDSAGFAACLNAATGFDPDALKSSSRFTDEVIAHELSGSNSPKGTQCPFNIPFKIRDGELTVFTGFSGHGKSLALSQFVAADLAVGQPCVIASLEIKPRKTLWLLMKQLLGYTPKEEKQVREAFEWMDGKVWVFDSFGSVNPDKIFEAFSYAVRRYGVKRTVIDSLLFCGFAEDDYNGQKKFVEQYMNFCQQHDVHGYLVCHSRKKEDESFQPGKFDVRGGAAITDAAWNGVSVWRNKAKNDALIEAQSDYQRAGIMDQPDGGIKMWKQRETGDEPSIPLWLHRDSGQFHDKPGQFGRKYLPVK